MVMLFVIMGALCLGLLCWPLCLYVGHSLPHFIFRCYHVDISFDTLPQSICAVAYVDF